ncbi:hypothetical protein SAMN04488601_1011568 [Paenibacillus sp. 453mf]|nr:hypothetical protein SAMN04488601_1011568 [Paenibacillus sp. 453mf]
MNTLNVVLPYEYVDKLTNLTWNDVSFAIENGFMSRISAIEHAFEIISKEPNPSKDVIDLTWLKDDKGVLYYLDRIISSTERDYNGSKKKFLYLILSWLYEHKTQYSDPLGMVEVIYADFDYPTEISEFVRYMPSQKPISDLYEENIAQLFREWKSYLTHEEDKYHKK